MLAYQMTSTDMDQELIRQVLGFWLWFLREKSPAVIITQYGNVVYSLHVQPRFSLTQL